MILARVVLATSLLCLAADPCRAAPSEAARAATNAFQDLCATGSVAPPSVLAKAQAKGWRAPGADGQSGLDPSTERLSPAGGPALLLRVGTATRLGERRDTCGVSIAAPADGLAEAVRDWLGFPPSFAMARSATFAVLRTDGGWRSGAALSAAAFQAAKADGRFYSIVVGDRGAEEPGEPYPAFVMLLHVQPEPAPPR